MTDSMTYAIIPARGGSKGVPRKNLKPFRGKPLLVHSIEYAQQAQGVHAVFVSTEDGEIASVAAAAGARIIERPQALAGDTATTESAIVHALEVWGEDGETPDRIVLLQATSPLRPAGSLDQALEIFQRESLDSLLSISPTHRFFWRLGPEGPVPEYDYQNRPRRQDMQPEDIRYVENGSLYIFTTQHFQKTGNRLGGKIGKVIFPEEYSHEIDSEADFRYQEILATILDRSRQEEK